MHDYDLQIRSKTEENCLVLNHLIDILGVISYRSPETQDAMLWTRHNIS
jgi:hypothetical protein